MVKHSRPLPKYKYFFIFSTYLALSATPFVSYLQGQPTANAPSLIGITLFTWITLWAIFKKPSWFHSLLFPAFLLVPIQIYLYWFYQQPLSAHHLGLILETSPKEALEFLGNIVWLFIASLILATAWWWLSWHYARQANKLAWTHRSRWLAIILLTLCAGTAYYGNHFGIQAPPNTSQEEENTDEETTHTSVSESTTPPSTSSLFNSTRFPALPHWASIINNTELLSRSWPLGWSIVAYQFSKERSYLKELALKNSNFKFNTTQNNMDNIPQIYVLVIGESSRYDRWQLNGYHRETNPFLSQISSKQLIPFSNMITGVSATRLSVPVILSRKPTTKSLQAGFSEKSILSAFKEAGFKTFWLSNQMSFGQFDTPVSVFAKEADVIQFLNFGGFTDQSSYDSVLLNPLNTAIKDPYPKKLIVLHSLGNHWNYSHRHPKEFDQWKPSLFGVKNPNYTDIKIKTALSNSYDNSILYTDWFLSKVINQLEKSAQISSLLYVSDHGQTLYDGDCDLAFHGHNTIYEFHIPAFAWVSPQYQSTFPNKVQQIIAHKNAKLTTENIFHSLLDMANIHYPKEQLKRSFVSPQFKYHQRYVDSNGWAHYDNSTLKGACKSVTDKGRPLPQ